jgi:hypothetical protein
LDGFDCRDAESGYLYEADADKDYSEDSVVACAFHDFASTGCSSGASSGVSGRIAGALCPHLQARPFHESMPPLRHPQTLQ